MKQLITISAVALMAFAAVAAVDTYQGVTVTPVAGPAIYAVGATTNAGVLIRNAEGQAALVVAITGGTTGAVNTAVAVTLQQSATNGAPWSAVTGTTVGITTNVGQVFTVKLDSNALKPYVRTIVAVTNDAVGVAATLNHYTKQP